MHLHRLLGGILGLAGGLALSCGGGEEDGDGSGGSCVPGMQVSCGCPGGGDGVQVCDTSGSFFGPCLCDDATGGGGETETEGATEGESNSGSGTTGGVCGDGVEDPGECDGAAPACPQDCGSVDDTTSGDSTGEDSCASDPVYVAMVPNVASRWESGALVGYGAGQQMCQQAAMAAGVPDPLLVGVCDYEQVVQAEMKGEFAAMAPGSTAWLHRTTTADIAGVPTQPGVGGRCVDWTYQTNHIADGEFVVFPGGGAVTYNLDNDTFYDGVDTTHTQAGLLQCGTEMRAILCCNPPCMAPG